MESKRYFYDEWKKDRIVKEVKMENHKDYALYVNYPNPFNPETNILYQIPEETKVKITIYNTLGKKIRILVNKNQPAGYYSVKWDGCDEKRQHVLSGIYIYEMKAENFRDIKRMLLMK